MKDVANLILSKNPETGNEEGSLEKYLGLTQLTKLFFKKRSVKFEPLPKPHNLICGRLEMRREVLKSTWGWHTKETKSPLSLCRIYAKGHFKLMLFQSPENLRLSAQKLKRKRTRTPFIAVQHSQISKVGWLIIIQTFRGVSSRGVLCIQRKGDRPKDIPISLLFHPGQQASSSSSSSSSSLFPLLSVCCLPTPFDLHPSLENGEEKEEAAEWKVANQPNKRKWRRRRRGTKGKRRRKRRRRKRPNAGYGDTCGQKGAIFSSDH